MLPLCNRFAIELEGIDCALGRLGRGSEESLDKTPGLRLVQLDGIVAANDFLGGFTNVEDNQRGERRIF